MADILSNLVLWYTMDTADISGTSVTDKSGGGNTGTLVGSPTTGVAGAKSGLGQSISLLASSFQYISNASLAAVMAGASAMTIAFWFTRSASTKAGVVGFTTTASYDCSLILYTNNLIYCALSNGVFRNPNYTYNATGWHHYAMVFDGPQSLGGNRITLYIDGSAKTLSGDTTYTSLPTAGNLSTFYVGNDIADSKYSEGSFDDVRVYARALSSADVAALYAFNGGSLLLNRRRRMFAA